MHRNTDWKTAAPLVSIPLALTAALAFHNPIFGFIGFLMTLYLVWYWIHTEKERDRAFAEYVETMGTTFDQVAKSAVFSMPFALALADESGRLIWYNDRFAHLVTHNDILGTQVQRLLPNFNLFPVDGEVIPQKIALNHRQYHFYTTPIRNEQNEEVDRVFLYGIDSTEAGLLEAACRDSALVCCLVYVDNYDDMRRGTHETERAILSANVDNRIVQYFTDHDAMVRKYEPDKYLLILGHAQAKRIIEKRFDLLDSVKNVAQSDAQVQPTLSIGMGVDAKNPAEAYRMARAAVDVALGRGGDQAVVKHQDQLQFYGGKNKAVEKRNKVKSRVIAHAMLQLIDQSETVFVMGHKNADMDAFGAAIGVLAAVRHSGRQGYLVLGDLNPAIDVIGNAFDNADDEIRPTRISGDAAVDRFDERSLLVVVDTHRKYSTEEPRLLDMAERIVLIDHHRRGADYIVDPTLTYLEPYASSTSELVTEILQYVGDGNILDKMEAEALLAGIMVDTKNFWYQTGVRTFEAASQLKRAGADSMDVQEYFKDDFESYLMRAEVVRNTDILFDHIALGSLDGIREDGILRAAQAADELLNIKDIEASFVLTEVEGAIHISARSLGRISVQLIMEKLGGGGHLTAAGAQLKDTDMERAQERVIEAIQEYEREEESA